MDELPETAEEGTKIWVWLGPGVGWQYEMANGKWVTAAGCACPYIPEIKDNDGTLRL